jgi:hypothetical protein
MIWFIIGAVIALGGGIYVGLGAPGMKGREDRVLPPGSRRHRLPRRHVHWFRPPER